MEGSPLGFAERAYESGVVAAAAWSESADAAAAEIARQLAPYDLSGLVVFISPDYDVQTFASEIARRFGVTPVVGCTTAGEITPEGWSEGAAVAIGFLRRHFVFLARPILELSNFHVEAGRELTKQLRAELGALRPGFAGKGVFGILLVDGMCRRGKRLCSRDRRSARAGAKRSVAEVVSDSH